MRDPNTRTISLRPLVAARRQIRGGLAQRVRPDAALAAIIGEHADTRGEITKRVWNYIKSRGLQDASDRRRINADDKLKALFEGKPQVSMFELTKLVNRHLRPE